MKERTDIETLRRKLLAAAAVVALPAAARAQGGGAVGRIIVPFAAGGAREMPARAIYNELAREMGQ